MKIITIQDIKQFMDQNNITAIMYHHDVIGNEYSITTRYRK